MADFLEDDIESAFIVAHGMELRVQAAPSTSLKAGFGAPDTSGSAAK